MIYFLAYLLSVPTTAALLAFLTEFEGKLSNKNFTFGEAMEETHYKIGFYTMSVISPLGIIVFTLAIIVDIIWYVINKRKEKKK